VNSGIDDMDQATRRDLHKAGRHSPLRLVVLTHAAEIAAPQTPERASGTDGGKAPGTALLSALLQLVGYGAPRSFVPAPAWTWSGPGECECCGAYLPELHRCGQCGSTSRLPRPKVPFAQYPHIGSAPPAFSFDICRE
jgi:hypothetical protein